MIPLNIFHYWNSSDIPEKMKNAIESLRNDNPEFNYYLYNEQTAREFIRLNFKKRILDAFDKVIPQSFKADIFRYCVIYVLGGIYLDVKYICNNFKLINLTNREHFCIDKPIKAVYTAILICKPKNKVIRQVLKQSIRNIENNYYGISSLEVTGPLLLSRFFNNYDDLVLIHDNSKIWLNGKPILKHYDGYYGGDRKEDYGKMWEQRKIFDISIRQ